MPTPKKKRRKIYHERSESGYCPRCQKKKRKSDKFIYCEDCREFFRGYNREASKQQNKKRKSLYKERKENNQCPRCGKKHGKTYTKIICRKCLDKQYVYNTGTKRR